MNPKLAIASLALPALLLASGCCTNTPRQIAHTLVQDQDYRFQEGFLRENKFQEVELAKLYKDADTYSGTTTAVIAREGFMDGHGTITLSPEPAKFMIHHSAPTLSVSSGFALISGNQSILETDKTTVHSWGTKFVVWVRQASGNQPRQDVVFAINNPVCVSVGVGLNIQRGEDCAKTNGTTVPAQKYLILTYPSGGGAPTIVGPAPIASADQQTLDFLRYARKCAYDVGVQPN